MSTREKIFSMLDLLDDAQLEELYNYLNVFLKMNGNTNDGSHDIIAELEDMKQHPEKYKSYSSFSELLEDIDNEV